MKEKVETVSILRGTLSTAAVPQVQLLLSWECNNAFILQIYLLKHCSNYNTGSTLLANDKRHNGKRRNLHMNKERKVLKQQQSSRSVLFDKASNHCRY